MNFHRIFIEASDRLEEKHIQARAEILTWLLAFRIFPVLMMIYFFHSAGEMENFEIMIGVGTVNAFCYLLSRTRHFTLAAYITILEPMIAMPNAVLHNPHNLGAGLGGSVALVIGPVLSAAVLPIRHTVFVILGTCISYCAIYLAIDPAYRTFVVVQLSAILSVACLAFLSTWLRDTYERSLQAERAKVLQSSKLASLGEMAGGVAHELNSPLGAIVLSSELAEELLADVEGSEEAREEVRSIGEVAQRMGKIISGLKTFARDAKDEGAAAIPVQKWIDESLGLCRQRFFNAGVKVEVATETLSAICNVQSIQISQTLVNLLNNSYDAIQGKQDKWIRIEGRPNGNYFEVLVTDSGNGIPKSQVEKIFEPFYTTKDFSHGTGLGLSISKGIVQNHGGDLVYDATSANTRFIIRLPLHDSSARTHSGPSKNERQAA